MGDGLKAVQAEAAAGSNIDMVSVPLAGVELQVRPVTQWRDSALSALHSGHFRVWAEKCLASDSYDVWLDVDPTVEEITAFFTAWGEITGQDAGKSLASQRSSRSTARR